MLGRRSQRDFEDEIRSHLELETERLRAQGLSAEDAERAARRNFGNVGVVEDRFYHAQRFASWVQDLGRDLRHAWRGAPSHAGLPRHLPSARSALAIGAVAGMFNVVNTVLLQPLPFPNPDRLVGHRGHRARVRISPSASASGAEFYLHYKERSKLHRRHLQLRRGHVHAAHRRTASSAFAMAWPTNDMYATLGVRPQLGRLPVPEDEDRVVAHQRPAVEQLVRTRSVGDREVVLRLRRHEADHRRHAAGVPASRATRRCSGSRRPSDSRTCGPARSALRSSRA